MSNMGECWKNYQNDDVTLRDRDPVLLTAAVNIMNRKCEKRRRFQERWRREFLTHITYSNQENYR